MPTARNYAGAAVLDGKIYVIGGWSNRNSNISTVEVYDPQANTWATAPPMSERRNGPGVAALGGKIYVAGGYVGGSDLASVEVFDPQTNSWSAVAPRALTRFFSASMLAF